MTFLPLAGTQFWNDAGHMDFSTLASLARRVQAVLSEMNYASKRVMALRLSAGLEQPDQAPDTYAEFLLRTSATSLHEPPARCR
jgi:predicted phosphoadenosine phosphosulfate sulfurtransferase